MLLNILGCAFSVLAIMYTYRCVAGVILKVGASAWQIFFMALGLVGAIGCFFIF